MLNESGSDSGQFRPFRQVAFDPSNNSDPITQTFLKIINSLGETGNIINFDELNSGFDALIQASNQNTENNNDGNFIPAAPETWDNPRNLQDYAAQKFQQSDSDLQKTAVLNTLKVINDCYKRFVPARASVGSSSSDVRSPLSQNQRANLRRIYNFLYQRASNIGIALDNDLPIKLEMRKKVTPVTRANLELDINPFDEMDNLHPVPDQRREEQPPPVGEQPSPVGEQPPPVGEQSSPVDNIRTPLLPARSNNSEASTQNQLQVNRRYGIWDVSLGACGFGALGTVGGVATGLGVAKLSGGPAYIGLTFFANAVVGSVTGFSGGFFLGAAIFGIAACIQNRRNSQRHLDIEQGNGLNTDEQTSYGTTINPRQ